jgi:hypothetical protein
MMINSMMRQGLRQARRETLKVTGLRVFSAPALNLVQESHPKLNEVPSLPYVGSTIHQYSGFHLDLDNITKTWRDLSKTNGPFYSIGLPGLGTTDANGTCYVIQAPHEMLKVLKQAGSFPCKFAIV